MIWLGLVGVVLLYIITSVCFFIYIIPRPGEGGWGSVRSNARANYHSRRLILAQGVIGVVTDFYILAIPLYMVPQLKLPFTKKLGIAGTFMTGLL